MSSYKILKTTYTYIIRSLANISKLPLYGALFTVGTMGHICTELSGGKSEERDNL